MTIVTAMTFHGPTQIKMPLQLQHINLTACAALAEAHPGKLWAGGQGLAQAFRDLPQNSRCKQNQQTTEAAVHLARELNCMDVEVS